MKCAYVCGHICIGTLSAYLCGDLSSPNSIHRKNTLLFWSWITFRLKEKTIRPTMSWNYRKNKVSDLKLVFTVLINNSSHAAENLKIHRICSSLAWDQWPRINLAAGCPQLPHHICGVRWSQDLWIPISLEQITLQVDQLLLYSNLDTCNNLLWVSAVSLCPSHHRGEKWTRADSARVLFCTFWQSLQNLTWQVLLKWDSHNLGSSHRSGAELNSFDNILGSKLLIHYHSLIN